MTKYGYIRVSSKDQKPERQVEALLNYGIEKENIFTDYMSGKTYASMCNAKGVPIDFIREPLGHSSLSTTYGYIYNPLTEKETYEALTKALISEKTPGDPKPNDAKNIIEFDEKRHLLPACCYSKDGISAA